MSTYDITLTDPLKNGFIIQPGAFDGPGGAQANTTLRLYGRGALEWGEAVDENLVRLTETFASASPPLYPLPGQLHMRIKYYWHDTSGATTSNWWVYSPDTKTWTRLNGTGVVASSAPANPTIGSYYLNTTTNVLYRWDTAYKQAAAAWMPRAYSASNLTGATPTALPEHSLLVWDAFANAGTGEWVAPLTVSVLSVQPTAPQLGALWYSITEGRLKIWTGTVWSEILGPGAGAAASGNIDMSMHQIINLTSGTITAGNTQAITGGAVYSYLTSAVSGLGSVYLPLVGGTISGNLTISGTTSAANVSVSGTLGVTGTSTLATANVSALSVSASATMGGQRITNVAAPVANTDAATKAYTDTAVANLSAQIGGVSVATASMVYGGTGTYKTGDICVQGTNIYIAINAGTVAPPSANWKLIYPAAFL